MATTAIVLAIVGILATIAVGWLVDTKTSKLLRRINAILIARITPAELGAMERLIEDIERTGEKRGTVVQNPDGAWIIKYEITVGGGTVKPTGILKRHLIR